MEVFLRLKHWQIFLLTFGVLLAVAGTQLFLEWNFHLEELGLDAAILNRIVAVVSVGTSIASTCWMYIVGIRLSEKRPADNLNDGMFKNTLYFLLVYEIFQNAIFPAVGFVMPQALSLLFSLATLAAYIYTDYFIAKALTSVEFNRETSFNDFVRTFFSFVFQPIGVWWLQPRINDIFDREAVTYDPDAPLDQQLII